MSYIIAHICTNTFVCNCLCKVIYIDEIQYIEIMKFCCFKHTLTKCIVDKEAWLIHILVDAYIPSYSLKCAEILHTVREPHDKVTIFL